MENVHTLRVAAAAVRAGVVGAALNVSGTKGLNAAIGLAADVLLLDIENREHAVEAMARGAEEGEIGVTITRTDCNQRQQSKEKEYPHVVGMRFQ